MQKIETDNRPLNIKELNDILDELIIKVYAFETEFVDSFIKEKEYDKYLKYVNIGPKPRVVIAPYFMFKRDMENEDIKGFMDLNKNGLEKFIEYNNKQSIPNIVAAQLVMDKEFLRSTDFISDISFIYNIKGFEYIFIWINEFSTIDCSKEEKQAFKYLIEALNKAGKKPIMAYGGYDSILLSHKQMKARLYGVAQSVGYGESRAITPVGGGLPVNKYYFKPLHKRMRFDEALKILWDTGYFDKSKSNAEHAEDYYKNICKCEQCKDIIKDDIDNYQIYNESVPYIVNARYGEIKRNRPTTGASLVAAFHFLFCKSEEWSQLEEYSLDELIAILINNYKTFGTEKELINIKEWCEIFA